MTTTKRFAFWTASPEQDDHHEMAEATLAESEGGAVLRGGRPHVTAQWIDPGCVLQKMQYCSVPCCTQPLDSSTGHLHQKTLTVKWLSMDILRIANWVELGARQMSRWCADRRWACWSPPDLEVHPC